MIHGESLAVDTGSGLPTEQAAGWRMLDKRRHPD